MRKYRFLTFLNFPFSHRPPSSAYRLCCSGYRSGGGLDHFNPGLYGMEDLFEDHFPDNDYIRHITGMLAGGIMFTVHQKFSGHYYIEGVGYDDSEHSYPEHPRNGLSPAFDGNETDCHSPYYWIRGAWSDFLPIRIYRRNLWRSLRTCCQPVFTKISGLVLQHLPWQEWQELWEGLPGQL